MRLGVGLRPIMFFTLLCWHRSKYLAEVLSQRTIFGLRPCRQLVPLSTGRTIVTVTLLYLLAVNINTHRTMSVSFIGSSLTTPKLATGFGSNTQPNQPNQTSLFGAAKPFGGTSTSGGGLFGNSTATAGSSTGFGGFGANNTTANTSSPFGGASTGGGLFGSTASKPAFGTGGSSGGLFGAGGFGTTNAQPTGAFGAPASTALSSVNPQTDGTGSTPFQPFTEKESGSAQTNHFQSISFMQPYQKFSFEVGSLSRACTVRSLLMLVFRN